MTSDDPAADVKFRLPSPMSQMVAVFGAQMRLYSKSRIAIIFIVLALLIPILALSGAAKTIIEYFGVPPSTSYLLMLLPLFSVVIPAMLAGRLLSSEFKDRTSYLLFTLPVERSTYYAGKFLAAMVLSTGVFAIAYSFAIICGSSMYGPSYPNDVFGSFIVCIAGTFAVLAMAYGLGPYFKRGSTGKVIAIMIFLPMIVAGVMMLLDFDEHTSNVLWDALKTLPPFTGYQSMNLIDKGVGGPFLGMLFQIFAGPHSWFVYMAVSVLWGAAFFALGLSKVNKKEL